MCNRYRLKAKPDALLALFNLPEAPLPAAIDAEYFPGKQVPVVTEHEGTRRLQEMAWGFPPFKGKRPINNTRSENAASSPFWQRHLGHRCVFPLTTAVEWQHQVNKQTGELRKVPHALSFRDGRVAAVAGIYAPGQGGACCSMMTCPANTLWATIHNAKPDDPRMVCFLLDQAAIAAWLDAEQPYDVVRDQLRPVPDDADIVLPLVPAEVEQLERAVVLPVGLELPLHADHPLARGVDGELAQVGGDPLPPQLLRHRRRRAGTDEEVGDEIAGVGGGLDDSLKQWLWFLRCRPR